MTANNKIVAIFGSGKTGENDESFRLAEQIGKALAKVGFTIANGGYDGTMLASARGAAFVGGDVIGVICSAFGRCGANEYATEVVRTDSLEERLKTLVDMADAYVVLPGGTGTLLELAYVWEFKNKGFLDAGKPIVIAGNFFQPLIDLLEKIDPGCSASVEIADTTDEVVDFVRREA